MKSKILTFQGSADLVRRALRRLEEDHISLSAAQASFFIITSVIPFISLLFALTGLLFPSVEEDPILRFPFPEELPALTWPAASAISPDHPLAPLWVSLALDALAEENGSPAAAAARLGRSTSSYLRNLRAQKLAWAAAQKIRAALGLPPLKAPGC